MRSYIVKKNHIGSAASEILDELYKKKTDKMFFGKKVVNFLAMKKYKY